MPQPIQLSRKAKSYTKNKTRYFWAKDEAQSLEFSQELSDTEFVKLNYLKSILHSHCHVAGILT